MRKRPFIKRKPDTSWQGVAKWYQKSVGENGLYYHQKVILPKVIEVMNLSPQSSLLDLACGQGILTKYIPKNTYYHGFDLSEDLIKYARNNCSNSSCRFDVADVSKDLKIKKNDFSHMTCILALQNIEDYSGVFENAQKYLRESGQMVIVLNHPYFRIPRQTSWGIDEARKIQYRRVDRYMSALKVPINMNPGRTMKSDQFSVNSERKLKVTWSFHNPLQNYSKALNETGFLIEEILELVSDKQSQGKAAKMENRARDEIPMFMVIVARKIGIS